MSSAPFKLGFIAAAVDAPGSSDRDLYRALFADVEAHLALGFDAAWMIEHHFSDYYPTPNPLLGLANVAGRYPELELGTSVLVTPWHNPLRLAEDIAMLSEMVEQPLHLGMGRGTAKFEYDAFGIDMGEGRERFRETLDIVRMALGGESFSYAGDHLSAPVPVRLRPDPVRELITLYGAIGSPSSASLMGEYGLPPICTSIGDLEKQRAGIETWRSTAAAHGHETDVELPLMVNTIVCETDDEAIAQAREHMSRFMQAQLDHYDFDNAKLENVKGYEQWAAIGENFKRLTIPENIDGWTRYQLIGSADTVAERVGRLLEIGFTHIILHGATPGVPLELRQEWSKRFVQDVVPRIAVHAG